MQVKSFLESGKKQVKYLDHVWRCSTTTSGNVRLRKGVRYAEGAGFMLGEIILMPMWSFEKLVASGTITE